MTDEKVIVLVNLHGDVALALSSSVLNPKQALPKGIDLQELLDQAQLVAETHVYITLNDLCEAQGLNTEFVTGTPITASDMN